MTNLETLPFTNSIGQVISPGDKVVIVTMCTKSVYTASGTYNGLVNGKVQCTKSVRESYYVFKDTREEVPNSYFIESNKRISEWSSEWMKANPGPTSYRYYTQPEYKAMREETMNKVEIAYRYVDRKTTLQRNRIYKLTD
jgi:hypothetical protein